MENEELFAGEPAIDAQQLARGEQRTVGVTKNTPLQVHTEPLLADDDLDEERPLHDEQPNEVDSRPRWRRPHVSDDGLIDRWEPRPRTFNLIAIADLVAVAIWPAFYARVWWPRCP